MQIEEKKTCKDTVSATGPLKSCFYGHCQGECGTCSPECDNGGVCMRRMVPNVNDTLGELEGEVTIALRNDYPTDGNTWVRYCKCPAGFIGSKCEVEQKPYIPWVYACIGFILTTIGMVGYMGTEHLSPIPKGRKLTVAIPDDMSSDFYLTAVNVFVQYYMMGCGVFVYAVPWSDFFLIDILRAVSSIFVDFFGILSDVLLPDSWSSKDSDAFKMLFATVAPVLLLATAMFMGKEKKDKKGKQEWNSLGATIIFFVLPLINIPVVATLFKPIVGCHLMVDSMNPMPLVLEDEINRNPPVEVSFLPTPLRNDCSLGDSQNTFFYLGTFLLIPFWLVGLYLGSAADANMMAFPVRTVLIGASPLSIALLPPLSHCCRCRCRPFHAAPFCSLSPRP